MPGIDGRALATAVKKDPQWRATPIVGLATAPEAERESGDVFDALAHKYDLVGLMSAIRTHIGAEARAA